MTVWGASGSLKKRVAQRRVRLSAKARGAAARPALKKRAARRRVRLSKKARSAVAGRGGGGADRSLEGVGLGGGGLTDVFFGGGG